MDFVKNYLIINIFKGFYIIYKMYIFIVVSSFVIGFLLSESCKDNKNYRRLCFYLDQNNYAFKQHYYNLQNVNEELKKD